jgi:nucleoside-diphosphate-sugar epimerase
MTGPIVIAGASGFVGRHLVDRLRQAGRDVV